MNLQIDRNLGEATPLVKATVDIKTRNAVIMLPTPRPRRPTTPRIQGVTL